jgi:hypothetical protein
MELRDISMDDLPMYERSLTDPNMMAELSGPLPREGLAQKLRGSWTTWRREPSGSP